MGGWVAFIPSKAGILATKNHYLGAVLRDVLDQVEGPHVWGEQRGREEAQEHEPAKGPSASMGR